MSHRDTVAALILLGGGLHFKSIEGPTLPADPDLNELRSDLAVEAVLVHAEEARGVTKPHKSWKKG